MAGELTKGRTPRLVTGIVFFRRGEDRLVSVENIIEALIQQVAFAAGSLFLPDELVQTYRRHMKSRSRPTLSELKDLLENSLREVDQYFIVIDALDECPRPLFHELTKYLLKLQPGFPLKLLASARDHLGYIDDRFKGVNVISVSANAIDLGEFIEQEVARSPALHIVYEEARLMEDLKRTLVRNADGM